MPRLLPLLLLLAACATPPQRPPARRIHRAAPRAETLDLSAPIASDLRPGVREGPARPLDYPVPAGGRLLATFDGPVRPAPPAELALPPELWLPAAPDAVAQAIRRGDLAGDLAIDGALEADVDGDGVREVVVLARPIELFEEEAPHRFALLLALVRDVEGYRLRSYRTFVPSQHRGRWCHAEYRIAGLLRRGRAEIPVVFEERGEGCAQLVGGGFDRVLHVADPGGAGVEVKIGSARLGPQNAADVYEAAAWAIPGEKGEEALWIRGITVGTRPCEVQLDPPYWIEELAARVFEQDGDVRAVKGKASLPLPDGTLPPQLLASHAASCGRR